MKTVATLAAICAITSLAAQELRPDRAVIGVAPLKSTYGETHEVRLRIPRLDSASLPGATVEGETLIWDYTAEVVKRKHLYSTIYDKDISDKVREYIHLNYRPRFPGMVFNAEYQAKDDNYLPFKGKLKIYLGQPLFPSGNVVFREDITVDGIADPKPKIDSVYGLYHDPRTDSTETLPPRCLNFTRGNANNMSYSHTKEGVTATVMREQLLYHKPALLPVLYDPKRLAEIHAAGGYASDFPDLQIPGIAVQLFRTLECGTPGTVGYINQRDQWVGTTVIMPPEFNPTAFLQGNDWSDRILVPDAQIQASGRYFGNQVKVFLEYKDSDKVKLLPLKVVAAWCNDNDGYSSLTFMMPNAETLQSLGDSPIHLLIDSGTGIATRRLQRP